MQPRSSLEIKNFLINMILILKGPRKLPKLILKKIPFPLKMEITIIMIHCLLLQEEDLEFLKLKALDYKMFIL